MKSFLEEVAEDILKMPYKLNDFVCILPSKRAGIFLKNELLKRTTKTSFGPVIHSIEDFVQELSGIKLASSTLLLFEFYQTYIELTPEKEREDFYTFSKWATTMIQDFNEIDRYLIPPDKIFSYLASIKELDHWYLQEQKTELQKNYIKFWNTLKTYYHAFRERLIEMQIGYQGLIYRKAVEGLALYIKNHSFKKHIFIGFNALNKAESTIIEEFLNVENADIFWDIDSHFLKDSIHDAGLFMRHYKKSWKHYQEHPFKNISKHFSEKKKIKIIGTPKNIGQTKYIGNLLKELKQKDTSLNSTAIVLGNESLLMPMVATIPSEIGVVNITSGFPLSLSPVASFFNLLFEMLENNSENGWYYKYVIDFLSHPLARILFTHTSEDYASVITKKIHEENVVYIDLNFIENILSKELYSLINYCFFSEKNTSIEQIIKKCLQLILKLKTHYNDQETNPLFLEYLYRFYEVFNQIDLLNSTYKSIHHLKALKGIYKEFLLQESVDFQGEPLEGLQLMGVLESRNLDFETIIISSVNEGVLPSGKSDGSFISFDVKNSFGLPTYKEKDAIYAYHFYHLLQRAKNIYLLYNTEPDVLEGSEKSRFLMQLLLDKLPSHQIEETIASPDTIFQQKYPIEIAKNPAIIATLKEVANKGFSPTSLTNYIRNPLDFYYQTILGVKNQEEIEETVAANTLGTVVHNTLEEFYKPLEGQKLTLEMLTSMELRVEEFVTIQFKDVYKSGDMTRGKNLIIFNIAINYIKKFLKQEKEALKKGANITILHIESDLRIPVTLPELNTPIFLRGKVDRVDKKDGILRIIDYKTGKVQRSDVEIIDWELLTSDYKYSKAFQVLAYAYMLHKDIQGDIEGGIISFKNTQSGFLKFAKKDKPGAYAKREVLITDQTHKNFLEELKKLILEIFNPEISFLEKEVN